MTSEGTASVEPSSTYTRTGDDGTTTLGDESRTDKSDLRMVAYGDTEEASAAIGLAIALATDLDESVITLLGRVQNDLVDVGADLGAPIETGVAALRVDRDYLGRLERACDHFNEELSPLPAFVLPGGTTAAALLHRARTVVRRAERAAVEALRQHGERMNPVTSAYLNRLSSLLFILARRANAEHSDTLWDPGFTTRLAETELWEPRPAAEAS